MMSRLVGSSSTSRIVAMQILRYGEADSKRSALSRRAHYIDVAAHQQAEPPAERQSQASAAILARDPAVGLRAFLEQVLLLLRRHADAGGAHLEDDPVMSYEPSTRRFVPLDRLGNRLSNGRPGF